MKNHKDRSKNEKRTPSKDQLVMGVHAIYELLTYVPDRLIRIFTEKPKSARKSDLIELCEKKSIPVSFVDQKTLEQMTGSESHQSVVAQIKSRIFHEIKPFLKSLEEKPRSLVVMADHILDPQNLGAIIRSAECLGADGLVWSKNRGADITPIVAKTSCGASELLPLIRVSNLAEAVSSFQKEGFEALAARMTPSAKNAFTFSFAPKTLLIVGSEGEGIQPLIEKKSDQSVYIPMTGRIESLNVSAASSILISLYQAQWARK